MLQSQIFLCMIKKNVNQFLKWITHQRRLAEHVSDFITEAIPEDLPLKQEFLMRLKNPSRQSENRDRLSYLPLLEDS